MAPENYLPELFIKKWQYPFFYLTGKPISLHLLRHRILAVKGHSFVLCASHLRQPRLVHHPGLLYLRIDNIIENTKVQILSY